MKIQLRHLILFITVLFALIGWGRMEEAKAQTSSWTGQHNGIYWLDDDIELTGSFALNGDLTLVSRGSHTITNPNSRTWMFGTSNHKFKIYTQNANDTVYIDGGSQFVDNDARKECTTQGLQGNLIWIGSGGSIDLSNVVLQNVRNTLSVYPWGGAIYSDNWSSTTNIILTNCKIRSCYAEDGGAAICFDNQELHNVTLNNVEICKCKSLQGGAIHTTSGGASVALTIEGGKIHDNESGLYGGGICWLAGKTDDSKLIIKGGAKIYNNVAKNNGGGIFGTGYIDIQDSEIYGNQAAGTADIPFYNDQPLYTGYTPGTGGAPNTPNYSTTQTTLYSKGCGGGVFIYSYSGTKTYMPKGRKTRPEDYNGQGIYFRVGSNVSIHHNTAANKGGGICIELFGNDFTGYIANNPDEAYLHDNSASPYWSNPFKICDAEISGSLYENSAPQGGGTYIRDYCPKWYRHTKSIAADPHYNNGNSKGWTGLLQRDITFKGATIRNNHATTDDGGGVYVLKSIRMKTEEVSSSNWEDAHTFCYGWYNNGSSTDWHSIWGSQRTSVWFGNGTEIYDNDAVRYGAGVFVTDNTHDLCRNFPENHHCYVRMNGVTISDNKCSNNGGGMHLHTVDFVIDGNSTITGNRVSTNGALGGGIYFAPATSTTLTSTMSLGTASMTVEGNTVNTVPNNLYLPTSMTMNMVSGHTFTPLYVGVYTQGDAAPIPVVSGAISGVVDGTVNIHDDKQKYEVTQSDKIYFSSGSPWSPLQKTVNTLPSKDVNDVYQIGTVEDLTAFLWLVNNIDTHHNFNADLGESETAHPEANGKLIDNIDMKGHYWVPIANITGYTGTFDGNGHTISGLSMVPTNISANRGLFGVNTSGTIKNVELNDCYFSGSGSYIGSIISQMNGGTLSNSVAQCQLTATANTCTVGGLVGHLNGGEVHSTVSTCDLTGYTMGGLAGEISTGNLYNSYANAKFDYKGSSKYFGGLVGVNAGRVENCYARLQNAAAPSNTYFGYLVGNNTSGTLNYSYAPASTYTASGMTGSQTGLSTFGTTATNAYEYRVRDNQVATTNSFAPVYDGHHIADNQLKKYLNNWVEQDAAHRAKYAQWLRPTTQVINDDYPLLKLHSFNAVAATSGEVALDYSDINVHLTNYQASNQAICFYGSKTGVNTNVGIGTAAPLYIDEDAVLTQNGDIQAYVGITLDNSACHAGANPSFTNITDNIDWHFFSSSLSGAEIGLEYTNPTQPYTYWQNPPDPQFTSTSQYFTTSFNCYYSEWDLYSYYEPDYHWINLKRNSLSHWHEDSPGTQITYTNETVFNPGQGFMVATAEECYLRAYGTLNNTATFNRPVTYTSGVSWTTREGQNLLGNPYQAYLDFDAFANDDNNKTLWNSSTTPFYIVMDEDQADYVTYLKGQSANDARASRYIHPHQGFMVKVGKAGTANFNASTMRKVTMDEGWTSTFRGNTENYALVNLFAKDCNGNRDMVTVELGRPDEGGLRKSLVPSTSTGRICCHSENVDYDLAFTKPGISEASIWFKTEEDAEYTLTWSTQHGDFTYLHLIDNLTGADTDCLATNEYKFSSRTSDYASRFRLVFGYTGIDEPELPEPLEGPTGSFAFQMGDQIVVNGEGTLRMFDVTGRLVSTVSVNGTQTTLSLPALPKGVYMLRIESNSGTQTQKIVIR